jgi:hypothetical protein
MIVSSIVPLQRSEKDEELNVCHLGMLGLEHHGLLLEFESPEEGNFTPLEMFGLRPSPFSTVDCARRLYADFYRPNR